MLEVLRRVIQEVNGARNLDAALSTMVRRIRKAMQTDVCSFYLYDKELESLVLMETIGLRTQAVGRVVLPLGEGLVGLVAKRSEPLNLEDAQSHSHFRYFEATGEERYSSFLGVPIIHQRHMLGVLVVQQAEKRRYDDEDEAFLVTMAAQLSGVLAHALATGNLTRPALPGGQAMFKGVAASPGMAMGEAVVITPPADLNSVPDLIPSDQEYEIARLKEAIGKTRDEIRAAAERLVNRISSQELALFDVYQQMLGEAALSEEVEKRIREGQWAPGALADVVRRHVQYLERVDDDYLRERAADIRDLGRRVLAHLQEDTPSTPETYPDNAILVGDEISVAMLGEVPRGRLVGLVAVRGAPGSGLCGDGGDGKVTVAASAVRASVSTSPPRAVFSSQAPSGIRASWSAPTMRRVESSRGACRDTTSEVDSNSSSPTRPTPRATASFSSRRGSATTTSTSRVRSRSITRRPTVDAPTSPMRRPRVPIRAWSTTGSRPRTARCRLRIPKTSLAIMTIAAKANSATGMALAAAAEVTVTSRAHRASVANGRTVPAAWATSRSTGRPASASASRAGHPHPVTRISTSAGRSDGVDDVRFPNLRSGNTASLTPSQVGETRSTIASNLVRAPPSRTTSSSPVAIIRAARGRGVNGGMAHHRRPPPPGTPNHSDPLTQ